MKTPGFFCIFRRFVVFPRHPQKVLAYLQVDFYCVFFFPSSFGSLFLLFSSLEFASVVAIILSFYFYFFQQLLFVLVFSFSVLHRGTGRLPFPKAILFYIIYSLVYERDEFAQGSPRRTFFFFPVRF
ncbi:hypothetical protein DFJ73DRAFT_854847 [Zopfochytrium polystomum]|nr:hypothetical protein DFJ73DRAFT_854847 [Zopfochytrium polystomum]